MFNILTLIIDKYNLVHILTILFFPLLAVVSYFIFRKKSEKTKAIYLWILMSIIFLATWTTFIISYVQDYNHQRANIWTRLPLHMCSINVTLYPLFFGLRKKIRPFFSSTLFAYMYFFGSAGAVLAMVVTAPSDCLGPTIHLLNYNVFTYWLKHGLIFILPILFVILGFYQPKLIDIVKACVFLIGLLCIMELVNLLFSRFNELNGGTGICNYFYTRTGKGTAVLEQFYNFLPYELIYMFPLAIIAIPIFFIYYLPIGIIEYVKKRNKTKRIC